MAWSNGACDTTTLVVRWPGSKVSCVPDLLAATAELVNIGSVSHDEGPFTDYLEGRLRNVAWLQVERLENNLVARTMLGRSQRLLLVGHTDTVPANGNATARIDGDLLWGLGSADMKSGLSVFLHLAETVPTPSVDVTYVFYECEEVAAKFNGLTKLFGTRPDLLAGDAAVLGEPTNAAIEAGCQGTLRAELCVSGRRAHTARAWMGRNAIHRLGLVLDRISSYEGRRPTIDGCTYREAIQAVRIEGGVAGNVVPDRATLTLNHRFAPDRTLDQALDALRAVIGDDVLADDATLTLVDAAPGAPPSLRHPLIRGLAQRVGTAPTAKLGWTDVAFFAAHGTPAVNFGPGDPTIAHTAAEHVTRRDIEAAHAALRGLITEE